MEADNAPKWWHAGICKIERKHAEIIHINIDNTLNRGENTHTYPSLNCLLLSAVNISDGTVGARQTVGSVRHYNSRC